ncbi:MAG: HTH domain-containing protein [Haloarculaceae archaeon]
MSPRPDSDQPPLAPPTEVSVADHGNAGRSTSGTTVEVCVRSLSDDVQPLLDETLRRLRAADDVEAVGVSVWGRSFDPTGPAAATDPGRALADRLEAFRRWADENGASFGPFFRPHTVGRLTGETCTRVDLPTVVLAEYRDGDLVFVAPCRLDDRHHSVLDRAGRLAAGESRSAASVDVPERVEPADENGASVRT